MKRLTFILLPVFILLLTHCDSDEAVCVSSTGKVITQERLAFPFNKVEVYDNINLILTQDPYITSIKVEAGENLIDGITTEIDSGRLVLRNTNACNWLRSFEVPVNVYLQFTRLDTLEFRAAANITCTNDWTNETIWVDVVEGAGQIDLKLNVFKSYLTVEFGTTTMNVSGFSQVTYISSQGYGPLHAEDLYSKFTYVYTFSPNDLFVYASVELAAEIKNTGNVYYRGNPPTVGLTGNGTGKLIAF
jgi:hypothetical protein